MQPACYTLVMAVKNNEVIHQLLLNGYFGISEFLVLMNTVICSLSIAVNFMEENIDFTQTGLEIYTVFCLSLHHFVE